MEGRIETENPNKPFLAQMDLTRGIKNPRRLTVRLFPTDDENDPRPYIARSLDGKEVELRPGEQEMAHILIHRNINPEISARMDFSRKIARTQEKRARKKLEVSP